LTRGLACVFAHPDDETFAVGGTLAHYAAAGIRVSLYTATDGDAGRSSGVPVASRAELGQLRRNELRAAGRILGIAHVEIGQYCDGTLSELDPAPLIGDVVRFLRQQRPAIVVTFGPEGAPTGHKDHRAISRAATASYFLAGIPTEYPEQIAGGLAPHAASRLFYVAWPPPATDAKLALQSLPATATIDITSLRERKLAGFMAHATQHGLLDRFTELGLTETEQFALAAGAPQPRRMIADLFDGL
jgi:LmbE family N-acetylglucosaminyl deacetylase